MFSTNDLSVADVTALLPRKQGKKVHVKTVIRWITRGCRGVKLEASKCGQNWFTSREKLEVFQQKLTERSIPTQSETTVRTPNERERARQAALDTLRREGVIR